MSVEVLRSPEQLIGKSILEIVSLLPTFPWYIETRGRHIPAKIDSLTIVDYDTWKPRQEIELYGHIAVNPGIPISMEELTSLLKPKPGRTTGLISRVGLGPLVEEEHFIDVSIPWAHIPFIDIDLLDIPGFCNEEKLRFIKKEIKQKTEIDSGVILASGRPGSLSFIGINRLLTESQLPTFLGACLTMIGPNKEYIVDSRWVGWSLNQMHYFLEFNKQEGIESSIYDFEIRFATLRITTSEKKPKLPVVIDVL